MKKLLFVFCFLCAALAGRAQYGYDVVRDEVGGQTMFVGKCTFDDLTDEPSFDWMNAANNNYMPDATTINELKKVLPSCKLIIFMGTWCEDSHKIMSKLQNVLLMAHAYNNYEMYALDRNKTSKENVQGQYGIKLLPTIIVTKNGQELGRIIEAPKTTLEGDLLRIASAEPSAAPQQKAAASEETMEFGMGAEPPVKSKPKAAEKDEDED